MHLDHLIIGKRDAAAVYPQQTKKTRRNTMQHM
jgi:hypothetical protein